MEEETNKFAKDLVSRLDPSLEVKRVLERKSGFEKGLGSGVIQVQASDGKDYVLKGGHSDYAVAQVRRERNAAKKTRNIQGVTHPVRFIQAQGFFGVLKEFFPGETLYHHDLSSQDLIRLQNLAELTVTQLHNAGLAGLDLHAGNWVIAPTKNDLRLVDLGIYLTRKAVYPGFVNSSIRDFSGLRSLFSFPNFYINRRAVLSEE
jgi:hypothetical protein